VLALSKQLLGATRDHPIKADFSTGGTFRAVIFLSTVYGSRESAA